VLLGTLLLVAGCGHNPGPSPSVAVDGSTLPPPSAPAPTSASSSSDYVAPIETMGSDGLDDASTAVLSVPAFERATVDGPRRPSG
jgi:hypothetical protein